MVTLLLKFLLNKAGDQVKKPGSLDFFYFLNSDNRRKLRITGDKMAACKLFRFAFGGCRQFSVFSE